MPSATLTTLAQSIAISSWRARMRTHRSEVHEAGEGDDPEVLGVDYIATIELGKDPALDIRMS